MDDKVKTIAELITVDDLDKDSPMAEWIRAAFRALYEGPGSRTDNLITYIRKYGIGPSDKGQL